MQSIDFIDSGSEGEIFPESRREGRASEFVSSEAHASDSFSADLGRFQKKYIDLWQGSPSTLPELGQAYDRDQQRDHEAKTDRQIERIERLLKAPPSLPRRRSVWRRQVQEQVEILAVEGLGMERRQSSLVMNDEFFDVTLDFARRARELDPTLEIQDLTQAWRNLWVMNLFQMMLGRPVSLTPSIFAYSMLYPYTDNPLDDGGSSFDSKRRVGARLEARLQGRAVEARYAHEEKVYELVADIEKEYPRAMHRQVYDSLLAIHRGQMASLAQHGNHGLDASDLLALSVAKGGASVLADGYLVQPRLPREQADFFFGYGVLLQLCDDLQDASEDLQTGQITLFSRQISQSNTFSKARLSHQTLDQLVCRLCHFSVAVLEGCEAFGRCQEQPLQELISDNCLRLIVHSVGSHPRHFSPSFRDFANRHSPLSFTYSQSRNQNLMPKWQGLLERCWGPKGDDMMRRVVEQRRATEYPAAGA